MKIEEAEEILRVSAKDEELVKKYLGFNYTNINILGNFNMYNYNRVANYGGGRKIPETEEEFKIAIEEFVNLYAVMYKQSKGQKLVGPLMRGTGYGFEEDTLHFLSTSKNIDVATRFCHTSNPFIVTYYVEENIPFLDVSKYKEDTSANEEEIIIAPFTKVASRDVVGFEYNGFPQCKVKLEKRELKPIESDDQISLYDELVAGFNQNLRDIKVGGQLRSDLEYKETDRPEECGNYYDFAIRTIQAKLDQERLKYDKAKFYKEDNKAKAILDEINFYQEKLDKIKQEEAVAKKEFNRMDKSTSEFAQKLQRLLEGMCKQKELEIDRAVETVQKHEMIQILSERFKLLPDQINNLKNTLGTVGKNLSEDERFLRHLAGSLGVAFPNGFYAYDIEKGIKSLDENMQNIQSLVSQTDLKLEDSFEDVSKIFENMTVLLDAVDSCVKASENFSNIRNAYRTQGEKAVKKELYEKVHQAIQMAKIENYKEERDELKNKKVGFLGRLMKKDILKEQQLRNLDIKIRIAQNESPKQLENYDVRDMLADMYVFAITENNNALTPEMSTICRNIKQVYRNGNFTEDYIMELANKKIRESKPVISPKRPLIFGRTKAKIDEIVTENNRLKDSLSQLGTSNSWQITSYDSTIIPNLKKQLHEMISKTTLRSKSNKEKEVLQEESVVGN